MSEENNSLHLPGYNDFVESIDTLSLPISASELHGMMCGYLCACANSQGEAYLRALINNKKNEGSRRAALALFSVYSVSQQQMSHFNFEFELLLPDDDESLIARTRAFSEWCEGFTQALILAGVGLEHLSEEDVQEALQHIKEFAELDLDSLDVDEEDEKALVEISEYTRMAVLRIHSDMVTNEKHQGGSGISH